MAPPGTRQIEIAGLKAWPALEVEEDGGWVRRAAGGYTRRANSVQSLDPADDENAAARIAGGRRWLEHRGVAPVFRVTPLAGRGVLAALDEAEWRATDLSRVLAMSLAGRTILSDARVEVLPVDGPRWLAGQRDLQGYDAATLERLAAIVAAIDVPVRGFLLCSTDGEALASALVAVADGIAIAGNVVAAATGRHKGYGTAVMLSGLAWAIDAGAGFAAIQVVADNRAALALYGSIGYGHVYDYHYRVPPE